MSACRVLEIGDRAHVAREHPTTTLAWTGPDHALPAALSRESCVVRPASGLVEQVRAGSFDVVVWHVPEPGIGKLGRGGARPWRLWYLSHRLRSLPTRWIVVDTRDRAKPTRGAVRLLERADAYFLRECPADDGGWSHVTAAKHSRKIQPVSIGLSRERLADLPRSPVAKSADVFFGGRADTPLRQAELPVLRELGRAGVRVDIADAPLPRAEFYRRCASAHLVWSPEGQGWQCFRHYEAAACGSVPLMNRPAIRQHQPLVDGEHGLHYDPAPGALAAAIVAALADRPRLERIAAAGRDLVLRHHTHRAICDRILSAAYSSAAK